MNPARIIFAVAGVVAVVSLCLMLYYIVVSGNRVTPEENQQTACEIASVVYQNTIAARDRSLLLTKDNPIEQSILSNSYYVALRRLEALPCDLHEK